MSWSRGKVYVGPVEVAGQYAAIVAALRTQGVPCHLHLRFDHPFSYAVDDVHPGRTLRVHRWVIRTRESRTLPHFPHRIALEMLRRITWTIHAIAAIARYRTFIFAFGMTFANGKDIPLLRMLGKRVIVIVSNGSEARAPYVDGHFLCASPTTLVEATRAKRRLLARIERWADVVIGAPLSSSTLMARPFVNYFSIGMPRPSVEDDSTPAHRVSDKGRVRILHAPSRNAIKGTARIREAVQGLIDAGLPIDLEELSDVSHDEVLDRLAAADIVVDQAFSDTPMATLAAEAAGLGRPAVVGGYGWDELRRWVSAEDWPPTAVCPPDDLRGTIEQLVTDPDYREQLGAKARRFVEDQWSEVAVGARLLRVLNRDVPPDWWVDPMAITYTNGGGISAADARRLVRTVVAKGGIEALCLEHNPRLAEAFASFAESDGVEPPVDSAREQG